MRLKVFALVVALMAVSLTAWAETGPEPAAVVIKEAVTKGVIKDNLVRLEMNVKIESHADGERVMTLMPADPAVTDWSVSSGWWGPKGYIRRAQDTLQFVSTGKGKYNVRINFVLSVEKERLGGKLALPTSSALVSRTEITVPGKDLEFTATPEVTMEQTPEGSSTKVVIYGGDKQVTLSWSPKAPEKALKPIVFAEQLMHLRIGQGVLRADTTITYAIIQGAISELEVRFPSDYSLLDISRKEVRTWDVVEPAQPGGPKTLKVALLAPVEKEFTLNLRLEKVLSEVEMEVAAPAVEPLNVVREHGQIAVSTAKGLSVETAQIKDISHVDVLEMQQTGVPASELRLGFRYLKRPFTLTLRTGEVVAKTSAEVHSIIRAGMDAMRVTAMINYTIRDAGLFQFRVRLDEGLKLVDITGPNINNWQLDESGHILTVALRSKAEGQYTLQVEAELEKPAADDVSVPAIHAMDVDRETGYVAVVPATGMKVETASLRGISQVDVKELPEAVLAQSPALAYRYIRPDYTLAINISEIEPEVQAEVRTIATLDEGELGLNTEIHYTIRRAGIFQVRVAIPKELRRRNVEGAEIDDTSWDEEKGVLTVNLRGKVSDQYLLRIQTDLPVKDVTNGLPIPVIRAVDVEKERGFLAVVTRSSVRVKPAEEQIHELDEISVSDLPPEMLRQAGEVALAFKYFSQPWSLTLAVERIEPRVTAEVFNLLSIGEKLMSVSATVKYTIQHAGVDTFAIKLPAGATAVDIEGEGIKHREEDKKTGVWTVTLQSKRTGAYTLYVNFQEKLSADDAFIPYAGVQALNVERETGYLAVTSRADVEVRVADADIENMTPLDSREIPAGYMEGVTLPVVLAFRYVSHPYNIRIGALPHSAAEVTVAVIESARLSTTITEDGNMITDLVCMLRNSRQQYLDLRLPPDARIWHAFVAGSGVTPLKDGEITKIPVARAAERPDAFEVRIRYSDTRSELGRIGSVRLESPLRDIDIMRLGWTLSLPSKYSVIRDKGTLNRLDRLDYMESSLKNINPDISVSGAPAQTRTVNAKGMSFQNDFNVRAQEQIDVTENAGRVNPSIYTGSKPSAGADFHFQSLIVNRKEPAWLQVQFVKTSLGAPAKGILALLTLIFCWLLWQMRRRARMLPVALALITALVVLGIRILLEGAYYDYLNVILWTLLAGAAIMFVGGIVQFAKSVAEVRRQQKQAEPVPPAIPAAKHAVEEKPEDKAE